MVQTLSQTSFDGSAVSALRYAEALSGLDGVQQKLAMSLLGLNAEQQEQILTMAAATAAMKQYTVAELEHILQMDAGHISNALNISSTEMVTEEVLKAALAHGVLTEAQLKSIATTNAQTAANTAQALSLKTMGAALKSSAVGFAMSPIGWITLLIGVLPLAIQGIQKLIVTQEEAYDSAEELRSKYESVESELEGLQGELDTSKSRVDELKRLSANGTITLVEQDELERLQRTNAELETTIARKKELAAMDAAEANKGYVNSFKKEKFSDNSRDVLETERDTIEEQYSTLLEKYRGYMAYPDSAIEWVEGEMEKASDLINRLDEISTVLTNGYDSVTGAFLDNTVDFGTHVNQLIATYNELNNKQKAGVELSEAQKDLLKNTREELLSLADKLDNDYLSKYVGEDVNTEQWQELLDIINKAVLPVEYFNEKLSELPKDCYDTLTKFGKAGEMTAAQVTELASKFPELSQWMSESGYTAEDVAANFNALSLAQTEAGGTTRNYLESLVDLKETMETLDDIYDVISQAQNEMFETGSVSADTISDLASLTDDYTKYLYEENGQIRINIDALRELAATKVDSNVQAIRDEISALEDENAELEKKIEYYKEQQNLGSDGGIWGRAIADTTNQIAANNKEIEKNLDLLGQYESLMNPWADTLSTFDSFTNAMTSLAEVQEAVANGFVISAEKAREFAAVYPELLEGATTSANGQIQLNADIVNSFLDGKEAELKGNVEAEIAKLEAEKAVLTAKMESAQAQLDLAQNIGEGEGQIAKDLAEYRITAGNAVAQAMIDAGMDEATAFKLAAEAMAQNAEEFDRVAMEVCTDVDGNFNQAAFDAAQTMYNNLTNIKRDLASVATQAHQTAKAIAGIASGTVKGSTGVVGGSGGGVGGSGIKLNLQSGSFNGTDYSFTPKESSLDDFVSKLQLDLSEYSSKIKSIDSQIALLRSLGNTKLSDYSPSKSKSDSGSGSKEIEEYIASIDDYREAIKRLNEAQQKRAEIEEKIANSDNLKEQILLQNKLIGAYKEEQAALHNLNNQRDSTINAGVKSLRDLGFAVQYNADTNKLWIENMEHLNELTAQSKGKYNSLQEATNALRKETEDLIESLTSLNEDNQEASANWKELKTSIKEAKEQIQELLREIVEQASEAVDSMQDVYDTLHSAADEYATSGYITVDTLQSIIKLGVQYVAYLIDENGQLVINEERIRGVVAARTEQLAIESSLSYIEALRIAQQANDIETLNNLLSATEAATNATWGLVYAELGLLGLSDEQYQAALSNINAIRALADSAITSIGNTANSVSDTLNEMKDGLDDILKYTMDMLKQRINDQIGALEDMKDAYSEIIDLKKESLKTSKEEANRQKTVASKLKEIAKLQARIDALSLDDSRAAQAEKAKLLEELSKLQEDLADYQADYAQDAQEDALGKMEDSYHKEKDKEIAILEDSISSYQKLYDMAIDYIENHWDTLYGELIDWNTEYGSVLNSEITSAWDNCLAAAQRYGDYVSALNSIDADISAAGSSGTNITVGQTNYDNTSSNEDQIHAIIKEMYSNSQAHHSADAAGKAYLNQRNLQLGSMLAQYGVYTHRDSNGAWYIDGTNQRLYDKYKEYIYHKGGIAGDNGSLKDNEILAKLEKGEPVLTEKMWDNLTAMMGRIDKLFDAFSDMPAYVGKTVLSDQLKFNRGDTVNNVTNNDSRPVNVSFGDTIINGAERDAVQKHITVNRDMVNQIARLLGMKW